MSPDGQFPLSDLGFGPMKGPKLVEPDAATREGANATFAVFSAYVLAGFSEVQAMRLVVAMVQAGAQRHGEAG